MRHSISNDQDDNADTITSAGDKPVVYSCVLPGSMPAKRLKIDSLELDVENPRITLATDPRDAMQKILNEQKAKLINLAESIAFKGLNPMDRFLVLRSQRVGKFVVIEGNRRLLAIKLLKNPALLSDLEMPAAFRKRLEKSALAFDLRTVEPVDCFEVSDRAQGNDWVRQRHIGEDSGRGIVDWSSIASSRFRGRAPALQALDFVLEHGKLTNDQAELISSKFPLTTLDRLLSTPTVRTTIGFEIQNGKLVTDLPAEEALKPLRRVVLDLAGKKINVTQLKSKEQQNEYIGKLKSADVPNLSKKTGTAVAVEAMTANDFVAKRASPGKKQGRLKPAPRIHVVPKGCKLSVTVPKIAGIFEELRTLLLSKHVHAIGVLLRVFLEMSVDEYLTKTAGVPLDFKNPKSGHVSDKTLKSKVNEAVDHMVVGGADRKDFLGVTKGLTDPSHPFSIETLHAYIHNRFFTPVDTHLTAAWDNAQPFFEKIWP